MLTLSFFIIRYVIFGFIVGILAKIIFPGDDPKGFIPTVLIGIVGSFVGGFIQWALGMGTPMIFASGWIFSIIGAIATCAAYRFYNRKK